MRGQAAAEAGVERESHRQGKQGGSPREGLAPETRVVLLDGSEPTIAGAAARYEAGEALWTLASTPAGRLVPVEITWAGVTRRHAEMVDVVLDNWAVVRCTPHHRFLTWDGEWVISGDLRRDQKLMPLYRATTFKGGWSGGYVRVSAKGGSGLWLHQIVATALDGRARTQEITHHMDGVKWNNAPANLQRMIRAEHNSYETARRHREDPGYNTKVRLGTAAYARSPRGRQKSRETMLRNMPALLAGRKPITEERRQQLRERIAKQQDRMQAARRARGVRTSRQLNHHVVDVRPAPWCEAVFDLAVRGHESFALGVGIFVHDRQDLADAWISAG